MPIIGINIEKCTNCKQCIKECPGVNFEIDKVEELVIFNPSRSCISCGHCISICPENAIIYKKMKDETLSFDGVQDPSTLISYEKMYRFIRAKRSIRQYKKKKIPKEIIKKVINSMRYAPTAVNIRRMRCLIISDEEKIKILSEAIQNELQLTMPAAYIEPIKERRAMGIDPIFYDAPHVIIIYSNSTLDYANAIIAMTYGMFCAETLGLGTCWMGLAFRVLSTNKEIQKNIAGIPRNVLAVMTIGYPSVKYFRTPPRPPLKTKGFDEFEL